MTEELQSEDLQLVVFRLAAEEYGLPITKVEEINRLVPITKLPQTPDFMEGIINLRGRIIPVIDLRKRFSLPAAGRGDEARIVMVEIRGQTAGIIVDAVTEVLHLQRAEVAPPPASFILDERYVVGVGKHGQRLVILLDIDQVITGAEEIVLREMAS